MGRKKKEDIAIVEAPKKKKGDVFEYITWLTTEKRKWEDLSFEEKKGFEPFIVSRFLSMDIFYCETINEVQEYVMRMQKDVVWKFYSALLPPVKPQITFIKDQSDKFNPAEITAMKKYFLESTSNCEEYLTLLKKTDEGREELAKILKLFEK